MPFPTKDQVILQKECPVSNCEVRVEYENLESRNAALVKERDKLIGTIGEVKEYISKAVVSDDERKRMALRILELETTMTVKDERISSLEVENQALRGDALRAGRERDRAVSELGKVKSTYELDDDVQRLRGVIKELERKRGVEEVNLRRLLERQDRLRRRYEKDFADANAMIRRYNEFVRQYERMGELVAERRRELVRVGEELALRRLEREGRGRLASRFLLARRRRRLKEELRREVSGG